MIGFFMFRYMGLPFRFAKPSGCLSRGGRAVFEMACEGLAGFGGLQREQADGAEDETAAELPEETRLYDAAHDAIPMKPMTMPTG
jgi:hypothetical protein